MTDSRAQIVPFGKYKGQPVEVMAEDRQYVEWLTTQPWFRERFQPIYNVMINNFGEPSETPEHNVIQAKFLDPAFRMVFLSAATNNFARYRKVFAEGARNTLECAQKASRSWWRPTPDEVAVAEAVLASDMQIRVHLLAVDFEVAGVDVSIFCRAELASHPSYRDDTCIGVEIKPVVADDYPAVLRQMKRTKATVLFTEAYKGTGATLEQVREIFRMSGFVVVLASDVGRQVAP